MCSRLWPRSVRSTVPEGMVPESTVRRCRLCAWRAVLALAEAPGLLATFVSCADCSVAWDGDVTNSHGARLVLGGCPVCGVVAGGGIVW